MLATDFAASSATQFASEGDNLWPRYTEGLPSLKSPVTLPPALASRCQFLLPAFQGHEDKDRIGLDPACPRGCRATELKCSGEEALGSTNLSSPCRATAGHRLSPASKSKDPL